ncbi:MAG TPA: TetR/AcrR family transcriptional regulator [Gemmatimonadaceae bacterium]|nr:TetR/AcrR family transcriptional regulator [Gemmatimonadaceae bacterium]
MHTSRAVARRQEQREELKAEMREAARAIFVRDGFQSLSMRKLAAEIGYSAAAIYLYFPSKEHLFHSLVEESFSRLSDSLAGLADEPSTSPVERLKRGGRLYVRWGCMHPNDYQIAFLLPVPLSGPYKTHQAFQTLRLLVVACLPAAGARDKRAETATQSIWAALHGITSLLIQRPSFPWRTKESVIQQVIDSAVDGAVTRSSRRGTHGGRNGRAR